MKPEPTKPADRDDRDDVQRDDRQPYEAPRVQSVKLSDEAAESLT